MQHDIDNSAPPPAAVPSKGIVPPPEPTRAAVAALARARGPRRAAAALEVSIPTIGKLAAGLLVQRATLTHVEARLAALAAPVADVSPPPQAA